MDPTDPRGRAKPMRKTIMISMPLQRNDLGAKALSLLSRSSIGTILEKIMAYEAIPLQSYLDGFGWKWSGAGGPQVPVLYRAWDTSAGLGTRARAERGR